MSEPVPTVPVGSGAGGDDSEAVDEEKASLEEGEDVGYDAGTRTTVQRIPMLSVRAGPRDGAAWRDRLKEEYKALIQYIKMNKENDNDWFVLNADDTGVR